MSISWLFKTLLSAALLPPLNGLLIAAAGLLLRRRHPRLGLALIVAGFVVIAALSLGVVSRALLVPLEARHPPLGAAHAELRGIDAIVILGAGRYRAAPEFGADDVVSTGLERLRYGALLARRSGKPVLVSGGAPDGGEGSEAQAMQMALQRDFGVSVRWLETASSDTAENAARSAELLRPHGVKKIALVTQAMHMPRAFQAFEAAGFAVLPAPTGFLASSPVSPLDFIPRAGAMHASSRALHEWIGQAWYGLRR
jgi:uncharacterized SAM-binding protein YcdF (DUF218 family)